MEDLVRNIACLGYFFGTDMDHLIKDPDLAKAAGFEAQEMILVKNRLSELEQVLIRASRAEVYGKDRKILSDGPALLDEVSNLLSSKKFIKARISSYLWEAADYENSFKRYFTRSPFLFVDILKKAREHGIAKRARDLKIQLEEVNRRHKIA